MPTRYGGGITEFKAGMNWYELMSFYFHNKHKFTKHTTGELAYGMDVDEITYSIKGHGFLDSIFLVRMYYGSVFKLYISSDGAEELFINEDSYGNAQVKNILMYSNYAGGNAAIDYTEETIKENLLFYTSTPSQTLKGVMPFKPIIFNQELKIRLTKNAYTGSGRNSTVFIINYFTLS